MEVSQLSTVEWCAKMRDEAYASGKPRDGEVYQELYQTWIQRENNSEPKPN